MARHAPAVDGWTAGAMRCPKTLKRLEAAEQAARHATGDLPFNTPFDATTAAKQ